ncbi:putative rhamnosyl transferase [Leptolyngbya sp. GB1-A1]|uniref:glycosyltransferase n=1 Tax=Leptolyngbya sp. GB1-A1 TaxID=2933908 RepID=UPI003296EFF0
MKKFQHFLITRFNVKVNFSSSAGLDPEWLAHRFDLFDRFCYPSVRAQSNQNFQWLVYFDADTPDCFKAKISEYSKWQNFIPIFLSEPFTDEVNRSVILSYLDGQTDFLITTRLDNDDAICDKFIAIVQSHFAQQEMQFINLPNGYVWQDGKLYSFEYLSNPFMSLIECIRDRTVSGFKTVLCGSHTQVAKIGTLKQIKTEPSWLQVIHDKNVSNRVRGIRQPLTKLKGRFSIAENIEFYRDGSISYSVDKAMSLLKYPFNAIATRLPDNVKSGIRNLILPRAF